MKKRLTKKALVMFRCSEKEKQEIENTAYEKGISMSEYIRELHRKEIYSKIK